jgi:polar amino acid transport system substrate-binding protein
LGVFEQQEITEACYPRIREQWSGAMFKHVLVCAAFAVMIMANPGNSQQSPSASRQAPVRIAHAMVFPPFAEVKDGKSEGLAVDILRAAVEQAGIEVEFVPVPFEQVQQTLEDGRAQAIFPLTITPERLPLFDFSEPLLVTGGALFVRAPNATPENLDALADQVVVTPRTGPLAAFIRKTAPKVKLLIVENYEESLARLIEGEANAAALNPAGARIAARLYPGQVTEPRKMFTELPFAVAVSKGCGEEFVSSLNAGLRTVRANGTWQQINNRWAGN